MGATRYVSDAIVELLAELDCRYLPLNPGSSFRGLHDSLVNHGPGLERPGPEVILCAHEEMCVAAAHAYAKATGSVGWSVVHDLVGLMHASMAVYNAWCDGAPVVVLGGGGPLDPGSRRPVDWFHSANVQSQLVRPFVKFDDDPVDAQSTLDAIAQAWQLTASAPTRPSYVTLDAAVQEQVAPGGLALPTADDFAPDPLLAARDADVAQAARMLWEARLPVLVAGHVGLDSRCTPLLVDIAERAGAACREERNLTALPSDHPLNLTGDGALLDDADVLLAVDVHDLNQLTCGGKSAPGGFRAEQRYRGTLIDLSLRTLAQGSWAHAGRAPRPVSLRLLGDAYTTLVALQAEVRRLDEQAGPAQRQERRERCGSLSKRRQALRERQGEVLERHWDDRPIAVQRMVAELWESVSDRDWLLVARNTRSWPEGIWKFDHGGQFLGHSGGGGIGYGPGALLGGALAARDRGQLPVGIVGDGDFLTGPGVVWTAVHHRIPLLVVIHNNRSFYNDEEHQAQVARMRDRPVERAGIGTRMHSPDIDFAAMSRSQGAWAPDPVQEPERLRAAFERAVEKVAAGGVAVVDVRTA